MNTDPNRRRLDRIRRHYDNQSERYDSFMSGPISGPLFKRGRLGVGEAASGAVLEIGIGTGLGLPHYRPETRVTGIDLSIRMLHQARNRSAELGVPVDLLEMDAQRLAFKAESFDSIVFSLCLCTIPDPARAITEALRVARPGASLIFLEHVRSHIPALGLLQDLVNPFTVRFESDHFNRRTLDTVLACGVEVTAVSRWALGFAILIVGRKPPAP